MLPGKLSIGFLQEDNPQKFYFRIRPLAVAEEKGYTVVEGALGDYADDGYIRIVPDKNEIVHFKSRMRSLGHYCVMDLRRHSGEGDKIRPNKNYGGPFGDRNAYIVYSDVIDRASPLKVAEVIEQDVEPEGLEVALPRSPLVFVKRGGKLAGPYAWTRFGEARANLHRPEGVEPIEIGLEEAGERLIEVALSEERRIELLTDLSEFGIRLPERFEPAPAFPPPPARFGPPAAPPAAQPIDPAPAEAESDAEPEKEPHSVWLGAPAVASARVIALRLSARDATLRDQSGMNPTRNRSLKDIIDEKWRQSRFDQLGHPIPPEAAGEPVKSPVEKAIDALREAWALAETRPRVIDEIAAITGIAGFGADEPDGEPKAEARGRAAQSLERLEAERMRLTSEVDSLRQGRQEAREALIGELRKGDAARLSEGEARRDALRAEIAEAEQTLARATRSAEVAEAALQRIQGDFDALVAERMATGRAADLMTALAREASPPPPAKRADLSGGELIAQTRVRFEAAGMPLSNDDAANLLTCFAVGKALMLSGPAGSGKSDAARLLGESLGLRACGRFAEIRPSADWQCLGEQIVGVTASGVPYAKLPDARRVLSERGGETPAILFIDDANDAPIERYAGDLLAAGEAGSPGELATGHRPIPLNPRLRVLLSVRDEGYPLTVKALDRAFVVRLPFAGYGWDWGEAGERGDAPDAAVSAESLRAIFDVGREIPGELSHRLTRLREDLSEFGAYISRRALIDIRRYLSAALPLMRCEPMDALDRAIAQRALPSILASAELRALKALSGMIEDLPRCLSLMGRPFALPPL